MKPSCLYFKRIIKVAGVLCVEIEWEICHVDFPLPSKSNAELRPKFKQAEVWDCPQTSLAAST